MPADPQRKRPTFKERLSISLAWLVGQWCRLMPRRALYWFADRCGTLAFQVLPTYRGNVWSNMAHALGPGASEAEIDAVTRRVFQTSARNFCDLMLVPYISDTQLRRAVRLSTESRANLDAALAHGKGALLVTAHLGAFDYVGQILVANGYPIRAIATRTVPEFIYYAVEHLRTCRGFVLDEATPGGVRRAMMALRRGEIVGLVADRDFFQSGRPATFFGQTTTLPPGPARMARQTGAPIVAAMPERLASGYELSIEPPFFVDRTADAEADVERALQRIVACLERYIRLVPEQWVMFQRVWPEHAPAALRVFPVGSPLDGEILGRGSDVSGPLTVPPEPPRDRTDSPPSPSPSRSRQQAARRE